MVLVHLSVPNVSLLYYILFFVLACRCFPFRPMVEFVALLIAFRGPTSIKHGETSTTSLW